MREIRLSGSGEGAVLSRPYLINTQPEKRSSMLFQLRLVELGPVVEIIQVDRIARSLGVVR